MKNLNFWMIFLLAAILGLQGCSKPSQVVGTWELESVSGVADPAKKVEVTLSLEENGDFHMVAGPTKLDGTWKLAEDQKKMSWFPKNAPQQDVVVASVDASTLVLKDPYGEGTSTYKRKK